MKKWAFRIVCFCLLVVDVIFLIIVLGSKGYREGGIYNILVFSTVTVGILAVWCVYRSFPGTYELQGITVGMVIAFSLSCFITTAHGVIYWLFLPKYSIDDAYKMIKDDPIYASELVVIPSPRYAYRIEGNPFERFGYVFFLETVDYESGNFRIKTSEIQFSQVTGEYRIGDSAETVIAVDTIEKYNMDCVCFVKDKKAQLYLHFLPKPSQIVYGHEFDFILHEFNSSYDELVKSGVNLTARRRPVLDEDDVRAFVSDMGENKLSGQLEDCVRLFFTHANERYQTDPEYQIEIKLYGADIAAYQIGSLLLKQR